MDDIKIFSKNEKELGTLIQTISIDIQNIGMEFEIKRMSCLWSKKEKGKQQKK